MENFDIPNFKLEDHRMIWRYSNRLVVQCSQTKSYMFFKLVDNTYVWMLSDTSFEHGRSIAEDVWNPKPKQSKINMRDLVLDQIDNNVCSILKKRQPLTKYDFCTVYYANDGWRCFYPEVQELIDYHMSKPESARNIGYLNYLNSEELKINRQLWDNESVVHVPAPEKK